MLKWVWCILRDDGGLWLQLIKAKYLRGRPLLAFPRAVRHLFLPSGAGGRGLWRWSLEHPVPALPRRGRSRGPVAASGLPPGSLSDFPGFGHVAAAAVRGVLSGLGLPGPVLGPGADLDLPLVEGPLPLSIRIFVWQLLRDRLPSGVEVAKRHGPGTGLCPLCGTPKTCSHILFSCSATRALWSFVQEALGPAWQAQELGEFLQTQANRAGGGRRLFWLVFAGISWTLWNMRNRMVIEKIFPSRVTDPVFSFLGFLQQWSPLVRQRDRSSFDDTLRTLRTAALPLSAPASSTSSVA
uniref:Uncharacterized protein n=1 Tax=Avena sativa TaxID=4498 RepID=A0ACD5WM96_AVESA